MNSCELPGPAARPAGAAVSRVLRFRAAAAPSEPNSWDGVAIAAYKAPADHHCGVNRAVLIGDSGEQTAFHVRYFEIAPGGNTTLEHHAHEHVVIVLRGHGEIRLGGTTHAVGHGDTVYVAPDEVHQLRNPSTNEPFGFLCLVDAVRDVPAVVGIG